MIRRPPDRLRFVAEVRNESSDVKWRPNSFTSMLREVDHIYAAQN